MAAVLLDTTPVGRRTSEKAVMASLAVALILFMVGGWDVPSAWRTPRSAEPPTAVAGRSAPGDMAAQARDDGVDVGRVMDTVRHRMVAEPSGALVSGDERYRASFDADGFEMAPAGDGSGALRVSTTDVARGSTVVDVTAGPWRGDANVAERSLAPAITERVTATAGQVEWDVVLSSRPAGRGDLRIDARVTGASGTPARVDGGLVWTVGAQRVVMGELVVKDRTGAELHRATPVPAGAGVRLTVPSSVLADAAYPVTVDPTIGPERPVSEPVTAPGLADQNPGSVAFDGTNYLVVWTDGRAGSGFNENTDVYGARVSRAGVVLDTTGIPIATGRGTQANADVAYDGTNYLVTWDDGYFAPSDVHGTRVGRDGSLLGPSFPIATGDLAQTEAAVSYDGTNYLVAWVQGADLNQQSDVYGARVTRDGVVLDTAPFRVGGDGFERLLGVDVAFDGTNHLVVWGNHTGDRNDIFGARVSRTGTVLDPAGIAISPTPRYGFAPALAFDGANYLVVWSDSGEGGNEVYGARVSREGLVLDPDGIRISPEVGHQGTPAIAFDGTNYLVTFDDNRTDFIGISGARVGRSGVVRDPTGFLIASGYGHPAAIAFDGTNYLVVWAGFHKDYDVEAARVTRAGAVRDGVPIAVSTAANAQSAPTVSFDGTNYLVVWEDNRSGTSDVYAARVTRDGAMLDGAGIALATGPGEDRTPAVAFDGSNHLVVWQEQLGSTTSVLGALVSTGGAVVGGTLVFTRESQQVADPDVDFDGTNFLVVWEFDGIRGARVDRLGTNLDPFGIPIATGAPEAHRDPAVAFDGTNHLVVWESSDSIHGKRISRAGRVVDPVPLLFSDSFGVNRTPALAFDGTNYLVVWQEILTANRQNIVATRVSPAGGILDPNRIFLPPNPGNSSYPDVAFNGSFLVVWQDRRPRATGYDVYGARVRRDGTVVDAEAFPIGNHANDEFSPSVAPGSDGHWGVVSHHFVDEAPYRSHRVLLRDVAPK
jgi:hypothetical protein